MVVGAWAGLVAVAVTWGYSVRADPRTHLGAPPFMGAWVPAAGWRLLPAAGVTVLAVAWAPALSGRLRWRVLLAAGAAAAAGWAVILALVDGAHALTAPLSSRFDYLHHLPRVGSVGPFLSTFVERLPSHATHVKTHPPGMLLVLWGLDRIGLGGAGWAAGLVIAGGASGVAAVLIALREVSGEAAARAAAPFVAFAPAAVFVATSADALFAGVAAWGLAMAVVATGRSGASAAGWAAAGGTVLGGAVFLSYGIVLLLPVVVAVAAARRRLPLLLPVAAGALLVVLAFALAGFWWLDGFQASRAAHLRGITGVRPYWYFVFANLAAFAVVISPATAFALTRLRDARAWLLVGGALAGVAVADLSGMSRGEVERIWLPFTPWVLLACAALRGRRQAWLALHAGSGLALQVLLRSPW